MVNVCVRQLEGFHVFNDCNRSY